MSRDSFAKFFKGLGVVVAALSVVLGVCIIFSSLWAKENYMAELGACVIKGVACAVIGWFLGQCFKGIASYLDGTHTMADMLPLFVCVLVAIVVGVLLFNTSADLTLATKKNTQLTTKVDKLTTQVERN